MQSFLKNLDIKIFYVIFSISLLFPFLMHAAAASDKSLRAETIENIANDNIVGENLKIRLAVIKALGNYAGTVVVMSPKTGLIHSIVNQEWAIRKGFKPCSTIKLVTAVAGQNENLIRSNGKLAKGFFKLSLDESLSYSNNTYFQKVGANLGSAKLINYSLKLGLGERTGINAPGEFKGKLPFGNENLRIYSHADDFKVTALQLAVMVSALTNGGYLVIPQIARTEDIKSNFRSFYRRKINLLDTVFEKIIPGMIGSVKYGTARNIRKLNLKVAGKTGSCIADNTWVGLFASVAPISNPRFAVVVITKGKHARGKYSAKIAGEIYRNLDLHFEDSLEDKLTFKNTVAKSSPLKTVNLRIVGKAKNSLLKLLKQSKKAVNNHAITTGKKDNTKQTRRAINKTLKHSLKKNANKSKKLFPTIVIKERNSPPPIEITRPRIVKK